MAALLIGLLGYWLGRVLPPMPLPAQPAPLAAAEPDTTSLTTKPIENDRAASVDTMSATSPQPAPVDESEGCQPQPLRFSSLKVGPVFHRYTGTINQERVTVELSWTPPDSITGRFYRWRGGPEYTLGEDEQRREPLVLPVRQGLPDYGGAGTWRLARVPGAVLRGVWVDTSGHRHPFQLRENYTGAAQYEIQVLQRSGGKPATDEENDCRVPYLRQEYLHLLGAAGRHPALRRLQPPTMAVRRQQLRDNYEPDSRTRHGVAGRLNDFNLLSYQTSYWADPFGGRPQPGTKSFLVDLVTGDSLTIASQLRPGYELPLRRLLTAHLLHDYSNTDAEWYWQQDDRPAAEQLVDLPRPERETLTEEDFLLTGDGLEATYSPFSVYTSPGGMPPASVLIPYAELRPLIRPGTPLARMLAARGIR
ncbi:hypothetical protein Q5H93_23360 [Hymenobacter sp. ASUV-10]|uniref:DUF3298 domain-containing protein n=1 Tax=Hymenobacter aranciens TaxID=3063996 RepID=A0ABT9BHF8_9BACT|nr:hypothetical protein [Hymenobacter sp. ASUV-10]MDO7877694.1 hypothetical protein [Hymenobacter sp. ASUV-10]